MTADFKRSWGYWWNDALWHCVGPDQFTLCSSHKKPDSYKPLFARPEDCSRFKDLNKVCETCNRRELEMLDKEEQQSLL